MKQTLLDLLTSKKFLVALVATVAWAVGLLGFDVDQAKLIEILSPLYAYVAAQAVADHGKEAAKLTAGAPANGDATRSAA